MAIQSNVNRRQSEDLLNTLFRDLNSHDFFTSFPSTNPVTTNNISDENRNLDRLKIKIDCFFQEHSNIVMTIKDYFYNEMMIYALKRAFKLSFNRTDIIRMERLLHRFFIEHENNVRIICTYFFDDIKPFLVKNQWLSFASQFSGVNALLNRGSCETLIVLLKTKGAELLTPRLYPASIVSNQNENSLTQTSAQATNEINFIPMFAYVFILCIIFGWKLFTIVFYFFVGLLILIFYVYF
jgi:hypothetical protein